jgi:tetratricopeptide (TPR) repeat protein
MAGRTGVAGRPPVANLNNRVGAGNFRSFGNTRVGGINGPNAIGGINGPNAVTGANRLNNLNRGVIANRGNVVNRDLGLTRANFLGNRTNLNVNRFNNVNGNFGGRGFNRGFNNGWRSPYYGYHRGWLNGYWGGFYPWSYGYGFGYPFGYGFGYPYGYGYGGWGLGTGFGYGLGWGLSNWLYGSALYGYGYSPYYNPYYYSSPTVAVVPYDYSQPINTVSPAPSEALTDEALSLFDSARGAFKQGNYEQALQQANQALEKTPNDTALHEFRALCLFALGRYDEAASTLYAVLSVGPGWDWTTLIGLYSSRDEYTTQLRALESYCREHPQSATARFVLAYQYLTEGYPDAAATTLRKIVELKPNDTLAAKLLEQLEAAEKSKSGEAPAPAPVPTNTAVPEGASISGTWKADPTPDTSVALTIEPGGPFTWEVTQKGQAQKFAGTSTFGGGVLTLAQDNGTVLVGRVSWSDPTHMTFRLVGEGPSDPGLSFSK